MYKRIGLSLWLLVGLSANSAWSADHVLIMTISDYPTQPLPGVRHDAQHALRIAESLGCQTQRAVKLSNQQLHREGILRALSELHRRMAPDDRVFIYYSGHGAHVQQGDVCMQSLVAHDEQHVFERELGQAIAPIRDTAREVLMIFDACHAGGLGELSVIQHRGISARTHDQALTPKQWIPRGDSACHPISNYTTFRGILESPSTTGTRSLINPEHNITIVAASSATEVALDDSRSGGFATNALLSCAVDQVAAQARDVSVIDLKNCAQARIHQRLLNNPQISHQTLEVYGANLRLYPDTRPTPVHTLTSHLLGTTAPIPALNTERSDHVELRILARSGLKAGDTVRFQVKSDFDGYLLLLNIDPQGRLLQLFPNIYSEKYNATRRIFEGRPISIPDASYGFDFYIIREPLGIGRLVAIVTADPLALTDITGPAANLEPIHNPTAYILTLKERLQSTPARPVRWALAELEYHTYP